MVQEKYCGVILWLRVYLSEEIMYHVKMEGPFGKIKGPNGMAGPEVFTTCTW